MRPTILVIDDDKPMRDMIGHVLRSSDYKVVDTQDGSEAVALVAHHRVDLVVMDLIMPDKDGFETLVEFRRDCPGVPVIAMSGFGSLAEVNYLKTAKDLGARDVLEKPFTATQLLALVRKILPEPS